MKKNAPKKIKISVALATHNEEENIVDCIESLKKFADEIIVLDGGSNDRTSQLASQCGAKVFSTSNQQMFHINKNLAINHCTGDWIFQIDADERITSALANELKAVVLSHPKENGFWINRKNWFLGGFLKKGGAYPDPVIRFFRKGKGHLPEISVHEQIEINGSVGHLKSDILHLADPNFKRYLERSDRYTSLTAERLKEEKVKKNLTTMLIYYFLKPTGTFFNVYIRHKGYQDGFRGFVWALFSASHYFYAYTKYWGGKE